MSDLCFNSQANVHELIQFGAAALVQVSAARVALAHQISQRPDGVGACRLAHALEAQHPRSFAVDVLGSLVKLETGH